MSSGQYVFGTGDIYSVTKAGFSNKIGTMQEFSVDFGFDTKKLHGQNGFPVALARGKASVEWKIGTADIDVQAYNELMFGEAAIASTSKYAVKMEPGAIPTTPFQVTVINTATFLQDLGVRFAATGLQLQQVAPAATPVANQYKVSAGGVYTFAAVDTGKAVLIDYMRSDSTKGRTIEITNKLMGGFPEFSLTAAGVFDGVTTTINLYRCMAGKLSMPFKQDDFLIKNIDGESFANAAGQVGYISVA